MNAIELVIEKWRSDAKKMWNNGDNGEACGTTDCADELERLNREAIEPMAEALRAIANRAGAPTMSYAPEIERREQRESLDWIAAKCAEVLATFEKESADAS